MRAEEILSSETGKKSEGHGCLRWWLVLNYLTQAVSYGLIVPTNAYPGLCQVIT